MKLTSEVDELSGIANFMVGDSDLWIAGRFEKLHLMNLLYAQRRLYRLEEEVNDHILYEQHLCGGHASHPKPTRPSEAIFADLQVAIVGYRDAVSSLASLKQSEAPAPHIIEALRKGVPRRAEFFKETGISNDFSREAQRHLAVATKPRDWSQRYFARHARLARLFREKHVVKGVPYTKFSESRLRKAEFGLVAVCLCVVQLLPVLALTLVTRKSIRLALIVLLILIVSTLNALFANTVRATNFGAIAAYSAIVVVFISQSDQK
ncbi:hypothetical protein IQ06DRAFT_378039 [Phaeosphaeriaceae sp. SRC1lsM3a]|nr:hypothetical protein IQ06DRAFT_378039 [Stagonospora sp. SRC1lsM3a]